MVDHDQPRFELAHSQRITNAKQSLRISTAEFFEFMSFHRQLKSALDAIRLSVSLDMESANPYIWQGIRRATPNLRQEGHLSSIVQTEFVMRPDRTFALVSVDAHSSRNLETMTSISRVDHAALTSSRRLIEGLRSRIHGSEVIFLKRRDGTIRRPELANVFKRYDIDVLHLSLEEALEYSKKQWPYILDMPLMQNGKTDMRELYDHATFVIEPFLHLSSQFTLALLSRPSGIGSFTDATLQRNIAKTYTMLSPAIPNDAVVKTAHPFSGQRVVGRYGPFYEKTESMAFAVDHFVAQEYIDPLTIEVANERVRCPVRLVFLSLKGEILTGMAIARVPANGKPAHDVALDIVIR